MRQIFTLISCLSLIFATAGQLPGVEGRSGFRHRCTATPPSPDTPCFIIDGVIAEHSAFRALDPNTIESIMILKDQEAKALMGIKGDKGVIIIRTKPAKERLICVKDLSTGEPVAAASVTLISTTNKKDIINLATDASGKIILNKVVPEKEYELRVTNIGYKNFSSVINSKQITNGYTVNLVREYKTLGEVIVTATSCPVRRVGCCTCPASQSRTQCTCLSAGLTIKTHPEEQKKELQLSGFKLYPNPVLRSQKMNVELISKDEEKLTLRLFGLDGKQISTSEHQASKGLNRFEYMIDAKLSSGVYMMQITNFNGALIKSEKLVIQ